MLVRIFRDLILNEDGQGMTEYAFVLGVLGAGALLFVKEVRNCIGDLVERIVLEIKDYISKIN